MATVGVTVDLARYRCMVHYADCSYYKTTHTHATLQVPPSAKWKLCSHCKPVAEDIVTIASEIIWAHNPADVMNLRGGMVLPLTDDVEKRSVRQDLNGGEPTVDRLR